MSSNDAVAPADAVAHTAPADSGWQALPTRARALFVVSTGAGFAISAAGAGMVLGLFVFSTPFWAIPLACLLPAAALGAWLGNKRYRYTRWLLDDDGFGLRRGHLWQSDTRVPGSRVQHLDIRRGPLERRCRLATLVIHTAGTRQNAVSVPGLDNSDAERLRDHLARQTDDDDDRGEYQSDNRGAEVAARAATAPEHGA